MSNGIEHNLNQGRVRTIRELAQSTSAVIEEILASRETNFLTKRGRFVAAVTPVGPGTFEPRAVAALAEQGLLDQVQPTGFARPGEVVDLADSQGETLADTGDEAFPCDVITLRDLSRNASGVINALLERGTPALLTRRGHVIATIVPLDRSAIEQRLLATLCDELGLDSDQSVKSNDYATAWFPLRFGS